MAAVNQNSELWIVDDTVGTEAGRKKRYQSYMASMSTEDAQGLSALASDLGHGISPDIVVEAYRSGVTPDSELARGLRDVASGTSFESPTFDKATGGGGFAGTSGEFQLAPEEQDFYDLPVLNQIKGVTRTAFNIATLPQEIIKGDIETVAGIATGSSAISEVDDIFEATSLWQQINNWSQQGDGWFGVGAEAGEAQEAARAKLWYNTDEEGLIPAAVDEEGNKLPYNDLTPRNLEQAAIEKITLEEGSNPYKAAEFLVAVTINVALDPVTFVTGGTLAAAKAARTAKHVSEVVKPGTKMARGGEKAQEIDLFLQADARTIEKATELKAKIAAAKASKETPESISLLEGQHKELQRIVKANKEEAASVGREKAMVSYMETQFTKMSEKAKGASVDDQINIVQGFVDKINNYRRSVVEATDSEWDLFYGARTKAATAATPTDPAAIKVYAASQRALDDAEAALKSRQVKLSPSRQRAVDISKGMTSDEVLALDKAVGWTVVAQNKAKALQKTSDTLSEVRKTLSVLRNRRKIAKRIGDKNLESTLVHQTQVLDDEVKGLSQVLLGGGAHAKRGAQLQRRAKKFLDERMPEGVGGADDATEEALHAMGTRMYDNVQKAAERSAKEAQRATDGVVRAEAQLVKAAGARHDQASKLQRMYGLVDDLEMAVFGDHAALRAVQNEAYGVAAGSGVDWGQFTRTMLGRKGEETLDALVNATDPMKIYQAGGRKLPYEVALEIANAATKLEVQQILGKFAGAANGLSKPLTGLGVRAFKAENKLSRGTETFAGSAKLGVAKLTLTAYNANKKIVPWAYKFNPNNLDVAVPAMMDLIDMATGTHKLLGGKATLKALGGRAGANALRDKIVRNMAEAAPGVERRTAVIEGVRELTEKIVQGRQLDNAEFSEDLAHAFTAGFTRAATKMKDDALETVTSGANYYPLKTAVGTAAEIKGVSLGSQSVPRHVSQLSEFFQLPDVREIQGILRAGQKYSRESGSLKKYTQEFIDHKIDQLFRVAMLVYRPAFVARNNGEAAFRQFLHGSLHDPLTLLSMSLNSGRNRKILKRMDAYEFDSLGNEFRSVKYLEDLTDAEYELAGAMYRTHSTLDAGFSPKMRAAGGETVASGAPGFVKGWAHHLNILKRDKVTGDVVRAAKGLEPKRHIKALMDDLGVSQREAVVYHFSRGDGQDVFKLMAAERPDHWGKILDDAADEATVAARIGTDDFVIDVNAMRQVLFDDPASMLAEAKGYLGDLDSGLVDNWFKLGTGEKDIQVMRRALTKFKKGQPEGAGLVPGHVWAPNSAMMAKSGLGKRSVEGFFHGAALAEGAMNWAPETKWAYWGRVEELFPLLNKTDQRAMLGVAKKSLKPFKHGTNKQTRTYNRLKKMAGAEEGTKASSFKSGVLKQQVTDVGEASGTISRLDIHKMAANVAAKDSMALFYDGFRRKQYWYSLRLAVPFGQAWSNTLVKWVQLAATPQGAVRLLAADKAYDAAIGGYTHYTDTEWLQKRQEILSDPSKRPLIYPDPITGDMVTGVPVEITKVLGWAAGAPVGMDTSDMFTAVTPLQSANLLTGGGSPFPGLGPALTVPYKALTNFTELNKFTPQWVSEWIDPFPTGMNQGATRVAYETFAPAWLKRMHAGVDPEFGTKEVESMAPSIGAYLVGKFPEKYDVNEVGVIGNQELLANDVTRLARTTSFFRGVFQAGSPSSAVFRFMLKSKDGDTDVTQVAASVDYASMLEDNNYDYDAAIKEFEDTYGTNSFLTITGRTKSQYVASTDAERYFEDNEHDLETHSKVAGMFFPYDGTYAPRFGADLRARKLKEYRTVEEMVESVNQSRYFHVSGWVDERVDRGLLSSKDGTALKKTYQDKFGVFYRPKEGPGQSEVDSMLRGALTDSSSRLKNTEAGKAALQYVQAREDATLKAGGKLSGEANMPVREWLRDYGQNLVKTHPQFERMWDKHYSKEVK